MLILYNAWNDGENPGVSIAAIFGVGLIGAHLVQNLLKRQYSIIQNLPFSWQIPQRWEKEKTDILDCIRNYVTQDHDHGTTPRRGGVYPRPYCIQNPASSDSPYRGGLYPLPTLAGINPAPTKPDLSKKHQSNFNLQNTTAAETNLNKQTRYRIDFVWSAGKGGFAMEEADAIPELEAFAEVVETAMTILRENPSCRVRFHMLSSAGGLFEGQRNVSTASMCAPRRPYGALKLSQEKILDDCNGLIRFIYRPTSVYGFAGLNRRMGLIPTLLLNGSKNKVCTIFGAPETLRDYVWADDIGVFMAGVIASQKALSDQFVLAAGKPSALFEILNRIEKILNKKLYCHYIKSGGNTEHNTFSTRTRPVGWNPLDLETGIRKTYIAMLYNL